MERTTAESILQNLHAAQNEMYAGGDVNPVRSLLTDDVTWHVPGRPRSTASSTAGGRSACTGYVTA